MRMSGPTISMSVWSTAPSTWRASPSICAGSSTAGRHARVTAPRPSSSRRRSMAANVRFNAWQFRQILGRGVHGVLLCQAESAEAVRAFVESCRYPHHSAGVDPALPSPIERMRGAAGAASGSRLGIGTRGRGSEATAAPVWGISPEQYLERCDPWPLNPKGELLLGVKLESPEGIANCESILAVPGLGFAELGPGDLGLALGYVAVPREPYPPEVKEARGRVF